MKKYLLLPITLLTIQTFAAEIEWADKFLEFKKMSKQHKMEWFEFGKKWETKKIDLMANHKAEWFDFGIEKIKRWRDATITTNADKTALFKEHLEKALAISKKHGEEWKEFYDEFQKDGGEKYANHVKSMQKFEEETFGKKIDKENDEDED